MSNVYSERRMSAGLPVRMSGQGKRAQSAVTLIAVAVIVENGGSIGSEATGGRVAAPIAKVVMQKAIELEGSAQ